MNNKFLIIGGDLRIRNLAHMLIEDGNEVYTYGISNVKNSIECKTIQEGVNKADIIIGPVPFSKDNIHILSEDNIKIEELTSVLENKILIAGNIKVYVYDELKNKNVKIIDILNKEEFAILNSISTAEGAIQVAMEKTEFILTGSNCLILGFGRIGKVLAKMLNGIGANVWCEARREQDLAWIKAYGYKGIHLDKLNENLEKFDIIFNTIPSIILNDTNLKYIKNNALIVELASAPGGVDKDVLNNYNINYELALALPGKVAPKTSAKFIKDIIYKTKEE